MSLPNYENLEKPFFSDIHIDKSGWKYFISSSGFKIMITRIRILSRLETSNNK